MVLSRCGGTDLPSSRHQCEGFAPHLGHWTEWAKVKGFFMGNREPLIALDRDSLKDTAHQLMLNKRDTR